jgi:K+-transporting ATPase ATPase B chain
MKKQSRTFNQKILITAIWRAILKLDPRSMIRNPVMFVVEIGAMLTLMLTIDPRIFGG